jgi:3-methyladenine DNA glycosylase AlkC
MSGQSVDVLAIFEDISNGYSVYQIENYGKIYLKHLTQSESLQIRDIYDRFLNEASVNGILGEEDQVALASKYGWWSEEKENQIRILKSTINRLNTTRSKLIYDSDKKRIDEQVNSEHEKLDKLNKERSSFIVMTSEEWATKKTSDFFLQNFLFKNEDLKELLFNKNLDEESENILDWATYYYFKYLSDFSSKIIKKTAISHHFQNILYIGSTSMEVFGKPVIKLTKNQHEVLIWGKYYQNIIKNSDAEIPDGVYDNPDKLDQWLESLKNRKRAESTSKNKKGNKGSTFLFGDRDDVKSIAGGDILGDKIISESQTKGSMGIYELASKS